MPHRPTWVSHFLPLAQRTLRGFLLEFCEFFVDGLDGLADLLAPCGWTVMKNRSRAALLLDGRVEDRLDVDPPVEQASRQFQARAASCR